MSLTAINVLLASLVVIQSVFMWWTLRGLNRKRDQLEAFWKQRNAALQDQINRLRYEGAGCLCRRKYTPDEFELMGTIDRLSQGPWQRAGESSKAGNPGEKSPALLRWLRGGS